MAVKCDGCVDRVSRGDQPACVDVCKVDALVFGELNDLVAEGRVREAGAVLAAPVLPTSPPPCRPGDPLAPWHAWGAAEVAATNAAEAHVTSSTGSANGHVVGTTPIDSENEGGPQ